ncbi:MAG: hypothetical protein GT589_03780 [Peptoclostridium sp.]|uniref:hypothetical protein n=1 Tax=Peptoclostridium sp. TaxID=1904860 RepID=UPI00139D9CB0|nr:hypothetical protein [Peptoclostridium sp.]MZQ75261.1 hypothetical protein [Peptoclostridium sp.]
MRILTDEQKISAIAYIKFKLLEDKWPFFTDAQIAMLLESNLNAQDLAVYEGLVAKSRVDSIELPGGLKKPSNREYWLSIAGEMRRKIAAAIEAGAYADIITEMEATGLMDVFRTSNGGGFYSMMRVDEI